MPTPSRIDHAERIKAIVVDIAFLEKLKEDIDPASGMSVAVRRGVPHDNPDNEHDAENRPWRSFEFNGYNKPLATEGAGVLIDLLLLDRKESLKRNLVWAKEDIKRLENAQYEAERMLS